MHFSGLDLVTVAALDRSISTAPRYGRMAAGREVAVAFEQFKVQLAMLLDEIAKNPADAHELQETLRERLGEMQAMGLPLPEDLVGLQAYLERDLEAGRPLPEEPEA